MIKLLSISPKRMTKSKFQTRCSFQTVQHLVDISINSFKCAHVLHILRLHTGNVGKWKPSLTICNDAITAKPSKLTDFVRTLNLMNDIKFANSVNQCRCRTLVKACSVGAVYSFEMHDFRSISISHFAFCISLHYANDGCIMKS